MSTHELVRITLGCGLQFAFDPTGAQYGWRETLSPWPVFQSHRVLMIRDEKPLPMREETSFLAYAFAAPARRPRCDCVKEAHVDLNREKLMVSLVRELICNAHKATIPDRGGLSKILQFPNNKFEQVIKPIMEGFKKKLLDERKDISQGPEGRLYWDGNMGHCLTQNEQKYDLLKNVWLTEAEWAKLSADGREALWKSRYEIAMKDVPSAEDHPEH